MLVQIGVVDAHPPLVVIFLLDEYRVGQPLGVVNLFDEPYCE